ncbi:2,4-dihydroxyhept-2-ene-1,7-dioic acid aldolase [Thalassospira sp. HF15]|uniref:HpcH/HpaI aldolase family protein n=1 Tax=Thalassospira sp. HF15 TaxID=2722755 RepID=UPI0014313A31|nr:aldolase/citrate lyase family protein [Thalassospira sp. HF15]NIY75318.1 2,4-dihydroxyhept-2-ene-1,7-dioic acid aldolase [Thalassospira sp. HF15]
MRENRVKTIWSEGGEVITGWLGIPSSVSAELMAQQGWDALTIDLQHGATDYVDALPMLQAISTTNTTPMVRVPWNDPAIIGKVLDAGAYGVICPMVNTRAEAEAFVKACRYAPVGTRSAGPLRASLYGGSDYIKEANKTIITMAMIETEEAVNNLEDILKTPELDAIFVGPSDLSLSMGESAGFDPRFPKVYDAIKYIAETCKKTDVIPGIHCGSVEYGVEMREMGYRFMAFLSDFRMLQQAVSQALPAFRAGQPIA